MAATVTTERDRGTIDYTSYLVDNVKTLKPSRTLILLVRDNKVMKVKDIRDKETIKLKIEDGDYLLHTLNTRFGAYLRNKYVLLIEKFEVKSDRVESHLLRNKITNTTTPDNFPNVFGEKNSDIITELQSYADAYANYMKQR